MTSSLCKSPSSPKRTIATYRYALRASCRACLFQAAPVIRWQKTAVLQRVGPAVRRGEGLGVSMQLPLC